jgi:TPR repeat protein
VSLYEQAWKEGVTVAAFQLGRLYENGVVFSQDKGQQKLAPDASRAWTWYGRGAQAGEPNSLARLAEREAQASHLMESFKYYAAAAERARSEDWPDDIWVAWRYRRASLARILEREGMMRQVGDAYAAIRTKYEYPPRP